MSDSPFFGKVPYEALEVSIWNTKIRTDWEIEIRYAYH